MKIQSVQKIIKIGANSKGVTLPARDIEALGLKLGDNILVSFQPLESTNPKTDQLLKDYEAFKQQYGQTLKNLADR